MISKEQSDQIKKQLIEQVNSNFPEEQKASAIEKIEIMNEKELEEFLIQNNLISQGEKGEISQDCIFCNIVQGKIPSTKIKENNSAIAILEINPMSKGHTIIVPKEHLNDVPEELDEFVEEVRDLLHKKLNAKDVVKESSNLMGHGITNLIPVYENENLSERKKSTPEELAKIKEEIINETEETPKEEPKEEKPEVLTKENHWLPVRMP